MKNAGRAHKAWQHVGPAGQCRAMTMRMSHRLRHDYARSWPFRHETVCFQVDCVYRPAASQ